jgi:hypothetical protein
MDSTRSYLLAAGAGVLIAHFLSRAPELRFMRLSQLVLVPAAMVLCVSFRGDIGGFVCFLAVLGFLVVLLAPNMAYYCGAGLSDFLDPQDWTAGEQEIALRPVQRLIDKNQYHQALAELDELFKAHKPTYEAVLLKAKLLNHFGRMGETVATLLSLIQLSKTTAQQLTVMELLRPLEAHHHHSPKPLAAGTRRVEIGHELILFPTDGDISPLHKEIPPGIYDVEETLHRNQRWLKLAGENWGNDERCWEAILAIQQPTALPAKKGVFWQIARMHQAITTAIKGQPRRQSQAEAQGLFHEAKQFIRRDQWDKALPLLEKASLCDPDRYEIAYRWMQAVRHTGGAAASAEAVSQVLKQSQWSVHEQEMLRQLTRSQAE